MATRKMELEQRVEQAISLGADALASQVPEEGVVELGFDGGALPDAHFILVHQILGFDEKELVPRLVRRLLDRQLAEGGWSLAPGMAGHLSTSVDAYVALRAAGYDASERPLRRARQFIESQGGLSKTRGPTRVTLALLGLHPWSETYIPPAELALLPAEAPVSVFRVSAMLRLHLLPLLVLRASEAVIAPALGQTIGRELRGRGLSRTIPAPSRPGVLRGEALAACLRLMAERLDEDGSLGGLLLATGWTALAARAIGLDGDHELVTSTRRGLRSFVHDAPGRDAHVQVCRPTVRSTAMCLKALRAAGGDEEAIRRASEAIVDLRAGAHGDFERFGPRGPIVAWSIKPRSERYPSLLDTVLVASSLAGLEGFEGDLARSLDWVASMQRRDGGFALFDRDAATAPWLNRLPLGLLTHTLNDDSSPEVTGRVLEAAKNLRFLDARQVDRATTFLGRSQRSDGSWQGAFSIGYLPATSAALAGLASWGAQSAPQVRRGVSFLVEQQRTEGGWGESPDSVEQGDYHDLGRCSPTQTAMALTGLIASRSLAAGPAIERGIWNLLWTQEPDGSWVDEDPTAASLTDVLFVNNPAEPLTWPLLALTAFLESRH